MEENVAVRINEAWHNNHASEINVAHWNRAAPGSWCPLSDFIDESGRRVDSDGHIRNKGLLFWVK